jgi:hypothetical protein
VSVVASTWRLQKVWTDFYDIGKKAVLRGKKVPSHLNVSLRSESFVEVSFYERYKAATQQSCNANCHDNDKA